MDNKHIQYSTNNFWTKFDYIAVICYTGYKTRFYELLPELRRVGLSNKVHIHWDFPSVYRDRLFNAVGKSSYNAKGGSFFMGVNHYNAIKTAQQLGCKSILVMEDDIRFLRDIKLIEAIVESLPADYDLALFDRSKPGDLSEEEFLDDIRKRPVNKFWRRYDTASSCGMYALSENGINHYLGIIEEEVRGDRIRNSDFYFKRGWKNTTYWESDKNLYFAYPNVAVQCIAGNQGSHCDMETYWQRNEDCGLNQKDYNMKPVITSGNFLSHLYEAIDREVNKNAKICSSIDGVGFCRCGKNLVIPYAFPKLRIRDTFDERHYDWCFIWGNGNTPKNIDSLSMAYRDDAPVVFCEDGFIRSYDTFVHNAIAWKYRQTHSIIYDTKAYYFDATRISTIEEMLNNPNVVVSKEQKKEARRLIGKIVENKISKYNHQPMECPAFGRAGVRKVLVVDQSYGDFSITRGLADDSTFDKMLKTAIEENPDADILVKTHPDTMAGKIAAKKGYYQDIAEDGNLYKVTTPVNPYSLMEMCDKVYVCSSQFGMEALMVGKEVHVFGMPFYAGWGLTIDAQHLDRRTNTRTLEELFYIFYCMYTHWVDPDKGCETTIDAVIDKMIALREEVNSKKRSGVSLTDPSVSENGYRIGPKPKVYYGHRQQSNLNPRPKGWNW